MGIGIIAGIIIGILVMIGVIWSRREAKKEAKKILQIGRIEDYASFKRTMAILGHARNDLEATDLWEKLQALSEQQSVDK